VRSELNKATTKTKAVRDQFRDASFELRVFGYQLLAAGFELRVPLVLSFSVGSESD
jgi:hypothetical protein